MTCVPLSDIIAFVSSGRAQNLAAQKTYNNLHVSMGEAVRRRMCFVEGVITCYAHETLDAVVERIVQAEVGGA